MVYTPMHPAEKIEHPDRLSGRSFLSDEATVEASKHVAYANKFWKANSRMFDRHSGIVVRAYLTDMDELIAFDDSSEIAQIKLKGHDPIVRVIFDGRRAQSQSFAWEVTTKSDNSGSDIRQVKVSLGDILGRQIDLDNRGNLIRHDLITTPASADVLGRIYGLVSQPVAQAEMNRTYKRRTGQVFEPLQHMIDYTHIYPYDIERLVPTADSAVDQLQMLPDDYQESPTLPIATGVHSVQ